MATTAAAGTIARPISDFTRCMRFVVSNIPIIKRGTTAFDRDVKLIFAFAVIAA